MGGGQDLRPEPASLSTDMLPASDPAPATAPEAGPTSAGSIVTSPEEAELREQWALVNTPLGEEWSGRTRYAAAMFFHKRGDMNAETLEVYRLCSRLDSEDPLPIIRDRGVGKAWLARLERGDAS
jgi:hypothetical protein